MLFSRVDRSIFGEWWWTVDRSLLFCFIILAVCGVILVSAASPAVADRIELDSFHFLKRHILFLAPALGVMIAVSFLSPRMIWRSGTVLFVACLVMMVMVFTTGSEIKGAQRWIRILGFSVQPSEFMKPALIIVCAWLMSVQKQQASFPGNIIAAGFFFLTLVLLMMQPDLGMSFVMAVGWATQVLLAGFPLRIIAALAVIGLMALMFAYLSFSHVQSRVDRFLDPQAGDNFQVDRSLDAFQNGGVLGAGPGQGTVKLTLPDAHSDFIISVAGEEFGLIFILMLLALYAAILLRGYGLLKKQTDMFAILAAGGLLTIFGVQTMIHIGSATQLLPAKGMTLPFISYGGSSIISVGLSLGVILALTRRSAQSRNSVDNKRFSSMKESASA